VADQRRPPPPPSPVLDYEAIGAVSSPPFFKATWPFGRYRASLEAVGIWCGTGRGWGSAQIGRREVAAIEYRCGRYGGSRVWIRRTNGMRSLLFLPFCFECLLDATVALGWPVREASHRAYAKEADRRLRGS
jgi:hypothetical protein